MSDVNDYLADPPGLNLGGGVASVEVVVHTAGASASLDAVSASVKKLDKDIGAKMNSIRYVWSYINHLASLGISTALKHAKSQKLISGLQTAQLAIQVTQSEFAVAHMLQMAIGATIKGDPFSLFQATLLFGLASMMQSTVFQLIETKVQAQRNEAFADAINAQIEAYEQ